MPQNGRFSITAEEYQAIPPTLQRKCFSTLERLRYAEANAKVDDTRLKSSNIERIPSRKLISSQSKSKLKESIKSSSHYRKSSPHSLPPGSAFALADITQEDVLWFSRLPDKVKRGYFSIEEEEVMSIKTNTFAFQRSLYRSGDSINKSLPSLQSPSSGPPSTDNNTLHSAITEADDMDAALINTFDWINRTPDLSLDDYHKILMESRSPTLYNSRSSSIYSPRPSTEFSESSEREAMSDHESVDVSKQLPERLDVSKTLAGASVPVRSLEEDIRRTKSFPGGSLVVKPSPEELLQEWGSGWGPKYASPVPHYATLQTIHSRKASMVSLVQRKTSDTSISEAHLNSRTPPTVMVTVPSPAKGERKAPMWVPESTKTSTPLEESTTLVKPDALHYLNPEARMKVRMYLGSASKFDEAVEFGFPSLPLASETSAPQTTGLDLESASLAEQDSGIKEGLRCIRASNKSPEYSAAPAPVVMPSSELPEFLSIPYNSLADHKSASFQDRKALIQAQLRQLDRDPYGNGIGREMTIRMTLTRPELRADGALSYAQSSSSVSNRPNTSYMTRKDPLQLEPLPLYENSPSFQPLGQRTLSFKRFWKRK